MTCIALSLVALVATGGLLAGCGDDPVAIEAMTPAQCLRAAGLDRVGRHELMTWRGYAPDGTDVGVSKLTTKTDATMTRQETTDRWAFAVDRYLITGPAKDADGSFTEKVAECLRPGRTSASPATAQRPAATEAGRRAGPRFAGVALGQTSQGVGVPRHRFFVADVYPLRLRDRAGNGTRFSVCLTRDQATLECQRGRTGAFTTRRLSSGSVFVTAPGRPGRYVYRWNVGGREVAAWRVDVKATAASPPATQTAPATTADRVAAKAGAMAFAKRNDPALARGKEIRSVCIRPSEADHFDCIVTYTRMNRAGDCFTVRVEVTVSKGVAGSAAGRPQQGPAKCSD